MGFRFRKSYKAGPLRINVSKSGIGYSVGTKGYRVTKQADGRTRKTYSLPGTGISYVTTSGKKKGARSRPAAPMPTGGSVPPATRIAPKKSRGLFITMRVLCVVLGLLGAALGLVYPVGWLFIVLAVWGWFKAKVYLPDVPDVPEDAEP